MKSKVRVQPSSYGSHILLSYKFLTLDVFNKQTGSILSAYFLFDLLSRAEEMDVLIWIMKKWNKTHKKYFRFKKSAEETGYPYSGKDSAEITHIFLMFWKAGMSDYSVFAMFYHVKGDAEKYIFSWKLRKC